MNRRNRITLLNVGAVATTAALAASLMFMSSSRAQGDLLQQSYLPLSDALAAAQAALDQCDNDGYGVSVAIVDRAGNTKLVLRGDNAGPHTITASQRKGFTAASLGQVTSALASNVANNAELEGLRSLDDRILILGGGLPIRIDGELVGGIGVAGAPGGNLDEVCGQAGLDAIGADTDDDGAATPEAEATGTVEVTGTVEATGTVEVTGTVEATGTVQVTETPDTTGTPDVTTTTTVTVTATP